MTVDHDNITWKHDLNEALKEAKQQQRPVLLDFTAAPM